jgi:hypothetical protein
MNNVLNGIKPHAFTLLKELGFQMQYVFNAFCSFMGLTEP